MLDFIGETRAVQEGLHNIILEIPEETYRTFYGEIDEKVAWDILEQYLKSRQDDARPSDVKIEHNRASHVVNIYANLHYLGNEKTEQAYYADDYIHSERK